MPGLVLFPTNEKYTHVLIVAISALVSNSCAEVKSMLMTMLVIVLLLVALGALPTWPHSRNWGYYPSGGLGLAVVILVILLLLGRI
jgi:hypothetical protein